MAKPMLIESIVVMGILSQPTTAGAVYGFRSATGRAGGGSTVMPPTQA